MSRPVVALILASGASWEPTVLALLDRAPGVVVLRRCVDVSDLLAAASSGQADVAVVAWEAPGFDQVAVDQLRRFEVRPVAVTPAESREDSRVQAGRLGVATLTDDRLAELPTALVGDLDALTDDDVATDQSETPSRSGSDAGRVLAVWGPAGAPGRTTVATAVAAELAARGRRTTLVDADPYGGSVAQQLGVLDEVSGLLAATRLAGSGLLEQRFASVQRSLGAHLSVVTGLPRAERWAELRAGSVEHLLEVAAAHGDVVVDTGFSLESDPVADLGSRPARNQATFGSLAVADEVLVVGSADPVGLARLARGVNDVAEVSPEATLRIVVNRMRPSLVWSTQDVAGMVEGFASGVRVHFLPEDRAAVDRALVAGRTLVESGDSALRRAIADLVDAIAPASAAAGRGRRRRPTTRRVKRRTADTARRR